MYFRKVWGTVDVTWLILCSGLQNSRDRQLKARTLNSEPLVTFLGIALVFPKYLATSITIR